MPRNDWEQGQLSMFTEEAQGTETSIENIPKAPAVSRCSSPKKLLSLQIDRLRLCPDQPRSYFDRDELVGLSESIKEHGVLQPVIVKKDVDGYMVVIGQRRVRAAQLAGVDYIPAIINDGDPLELALIENLQRSNLTAIEEGEGLARLKDMKGYTLEQLGSILGKAKSTISEMISLANLPEEIRNECRHDANIPRSILVDIARKDTPKEMLLAYHAFRTKGLRRDAIRGNHRSSGTIVKRLTGILTTFGKRLGEFEPDQINDINGSQRISIRNELKILETKIKDLIVKLDT